MKNFASCNCGKLTLCAEDKPIRVSICHCFECQKRTGSAYAAQARFSIDKVSISGDCKDYTRTGDSGSKITFSFCTDCGSTMFYKFRDLPEVIIIPLGVFEAPEFPAPSISVYEERKLPWVTLPAGIEHID